MKKRKKKRRKKKNEKKKNTHTHVHNAHKNTLFDTNEQKRALCFVVVLSPKSKPPAKLSPASLPVQGIRQLSLQLP